MEQATNRTVTNQHLIWKEKSLLTNAGEIQVLTLVLAAITDYLFERLEVCIILKLLNYTVQYVFIFMHMVE